METDPQKLFDLIDAEYRDVPDAGLLDETPRRAVTHVEESSCLAGLHRLQDMAGETA